MNKRKRASSGSLFLMELILAILLFCIAAAICVSVFAKSHIMHQDAKTLNMAMNTVQNTAEIIRSENDINEIKSKLNNLYPDSDISKSFPGTSEAYFDSNMSTISSKNDATYILEIVCENKNDLLCSTITMKKNIVDNNLDPIYDLYIEHALY